MMSVIEADLSGLDADRLEAQICAMAGRRAADECAWLSLIGEFDRREGYAVWECRSTAHWLNWHCGLSMAAARERVRVARALERLPVLRVALAAGQVTYSKVRAVTRVATAAIETMLVELALAGTASQLDRICSAYRRVRRYEIDRALAHDAPEGEEAQAAARASLAALSTWHDDDGMTVLRAVIVPEVGGRAPQRWCLSQQRSRGSVGRRRHPPDSCRCPGRAGPLLPGHQLGRAGRGAPPPRDAGRRRRRHRAG